MDKIDVNEIDFSKLNKLDVESSENTVYLDDKDEKIYKIFLSKDLDLSKKKEENLEALNDIRRDINIVIPENKIMSNSVLIGTIERYIKGDDLRNINHRFSNIYDKILFCLDMSKTLEEIHKENIVVSDINPGNVRIGEDKKAYYIDILNAGINGSSPLATSKILLNYIRNVKLDTKNVTKELDRITMMMLIFETLFNKEFYYITYYEYMFRAEKIKTLMDLVSYYELIRTNQKNIDMPYLHEIISDCDVKKYKKEMR